MARSATSSFKLPAPPSSIASSLRQTPVVRWLGSTDKTTGDDDPKEASDALKQAMEDEPFALRSDSPIDLVRPPQAHIASHARPFRQPALLDELARAARPTASSPVPLSAAGSSSPAFSSQAPNIFSQHPPTRTSVDYLRSLNSRDRGISTTAVSHAPSLSSPTRWWFQDGNKAEVDQLLGEEDRASTIQKEAENIRQKYLAPKHPVVFCHGLLGFDMIQFGPAMAPLQISHWRGIKEVLEGNGVEVLITRVPATSSVHDRAKVLEEKITETYPGREVHLIGHSMGGLDCRYLTSQLRPKAFKVLSVTTIATPHRGSYFANYFLDTLGKDRLPTLKTLLERLPIGGGDGKAFEGLTLEAMARFNEETPDVEGVKYFSWGAKFEPSLIDTFKWSHGVILEKEGPNDGLVSVRSAQWGKYLGTIEDVNHLDLVGWINVARYKLAEWAGKEIKFKPATFYLGITHTIAEQVEGLTWEDEEEKGKKEQAAAGSMSCANGGDVGTVGPAPGVE